MRTVEPHAYGVDKKGRYLLRAFQIAGGSESGEYVGWKLFCADEISNLEVLDATFSGPRPEYKKRDPAIRAIIAEL